MAIHGLMQRANQTDYHLAFSLVWCKVGCGRQGVCRRHRQSEPEALALCLSRAGVTQHARLFTAAQGASWPSFADR